MPEGQPTTFDPTETNELYDELYDSWVLARDFAEMHLSILREGDHLDRFGFGETANEATAQWNWRMNAAIGIDHCADLINLRVDNIFRTPPVRAFDDSPYAEFITEFLADVDRGGTDMTAFMRQNLPRYYALGVDFVVDKDAATVATPQTLAQERAMGLLPYLHAFTPLERLAWSCDHAGRYQWVRYDMGQAGRVDETSAVEGDHLYLTLLPSEWRLYIVPGEGDMVTRQGVVSLGQCPVVSMYWKTSMRADYPQVPISLLTRIAPIARYLLNLMSQIQIDIYRNVAFLAATGVSADQIPTELSPMCVWALPEGATLADVSGDVEHIRVKLQLAQSLMDTILRIGKLTGGAGDLQSRASSGVQVAVERTDLDNEMRMTAAQAEQVERDLVWMAVCRYLGKRVDKDTIGYSVEYNKKYVLTGADQLIAQAKEFVGLGVEGEVPTLLKLLLRKILDAVATENDTDYAAALKEIEAAVFDSLGGPLPEFMGGDQGDGEEAEANEEAQTEEPLGDQLDLDEAVDE